MAGPFDKFFGGGGGNMFGGNSLYADMLTPEQLAAVRQQSMMQVAAKLLESSGPSPVRRTLGQTLGSALGAGAEAMQTGQTNAVQQMLLKQKLDEAKAERAQNDRIRQMIGGGDATIDTINAPVDTAGRVGPTVQRAAMPTTAVNPLMAGLTDQQRAILQVTPTSRVPDVLAGFQKDQAAMSEVTGQPFEVVDATGRPILVQQTKGGKITTLEGFGPKREIVLENMGGRTVAIDKKSLKGGETFQRTMTPGEAASNQVALGNLGVAQGNLALSRDRFAREGQPGAGNATEGERKAATLLSRVSIAEQQIGEATKAAPGAAAPGLFNPLTPRVMQSEGRKQVEDAQDEFLDAALTLSTGAAYTKEQFDAARRTYFPAVNDDAQTIKDKENRRKNVIAAAKLAAGRAAGSVPAMPPSRFEQPAAAALPSGLGTGTFNVESYFAPQPR